MAGKRRRGRVTFAAFLSHTVFHPVWALHLSQGRDLSRQLLTTRAASPAQHSAGLTTCPGHALEVRYGFPSSPRTEPSSQWSFRKIELNLLDK